jgi:DNA topoisomerase IA
LKSGTKFYPTKMGLELIEGYEHIGVPVYKPEIRADLEH